MFNFYSFKRIEFKSNPPLPEHPVVEPLEENGKIVNKVIMKPTSNRSFFDGIHYTADEMSLRAKLNIGAKLTYVSNVNIENDPTQVQRNMLRVEQEITSKLNELSSPEVNVNDVSPSN